MKVVKKKRKKKIGGTEYESEEYYLHIYVPKGFVERWGEHYITEIDYASGTITVKPRRKEEDKGSGEPVHTDTDKGQKQGQDRGNTELANTVIQ